MTWLPRTIALPLLILTGLAAAAWLPSEPTARDSERIEFRYTADGWLPVSELVAAASMPDASWPERLPPLTVATMQLLASLLVLLLFEREQAAGPSLKPVASTGPESR